MGKGRGKEIGREMESKREKGKEGKEEREDKGGKGKRKGG